LISLLSLKGIAGTAQIKTVIDSIGASYGVLSEHEILLTFIEGMADKVSATTDKSPKCLWWCAPPKAAIENTYTVLELGRGRH